MLRLRLSQDGSMKVLEGFEGLDCRAHGDD